MQSFRVLCAASALISNSGHLIEFPGLASTPGAARKQRSSGTIFDVGS